MDELIDSIFSKGNEWNVIIVAFILGAIYTLVKIGIKKLLKKNRPGPQKRVIKTKGSI